MERSSQNYIDTAFRISTEILKSAIWNGESCNWIGYSLGSVQEKTQFVFRSIGNDRFSGTSGIALFLAYLYKYSKDPIVFQTMKGALNQAKQLLEHEDPEIGNYSLHGGRLGVAQTFIVAGNICSREDWKSIGSTTIRNACSTDLLKSPMDANDGLTGYILSLKEYYQYTHDEEVKQAIIRAANRLVSKRIPEETNMEFSFGSSGEALALLEAYELHAEKKYCKRAFDIFELERKFMLTHSCRFEEAGQTESRANKYFWISLVLRIAQVRLRSFQLINNNTLKEDAECAMIKIAHYVEDEISNPIKVSNFSLCSGLAGLGDTLLSAAYILDNVYYEKLAHQIARLGIENYGDMDIDWPSDQIALSKVGQNTRQIPGMMYGLAGIGQFYIRLAFPPEVQSILTPGLNLFKI